MIWSELGASRGGGGRRAAAAAAAAASAASALPLKSCTYKLPVHPRSRLPAQRRPKKQCKIRKTHRWWCWPPALPRPPGCLRCLPIRPWPADTWPRFLRLALKPAATQKRDGPQQVRRRHSRSSHSRAAALRAAQRRGLPAASPPAASSPALLPLLPLRLLPPPRRRCCRCCRCSCCRSCRSGPQHKRCNAVAAAPPAATAAAVAAAAAAAAGRRAGVQQQLLHCGRRLSPPPRRKSCSCSRFRGCRARVAASRTTRTGTSPTKRRRRCQLRAKLSLFFAASWLPPAFVLPRFLGYLPLAPRPCVAALPPNAHRAATLPRPGPSPPSPSAHALSQLTGRHFKPAAARTVGRTGRQHVSTSGKQRRLRTGRPAGLGRRGLHRGPCMARRPRYRAAKPGGCSRRPQHVRRAAGPHAPSSGPSGCADAAVRLPPGPGAGQQHGALPGPPDPAAGRRSPRPPPPTHLQLLPCTSKRPRRACRAGKCAWGDPVSARSSEGPQGRPAGLASGSNCPAVHTDVAHRACKPPPARCAPAPSPAQPPAPLP